MRTITLPLLLFLLLVLCLLASASSFYDNPEQDPIPYPPGTAEENEGGKDELEKLWGTDVSSEKMNGAYFFVFEVSLFVLDSGV